MTHRDLIGCADSTALSVVVSQSILGCAASDAIAATTDTTSTSTSPSCVLTAALTEGPYFVDEMPNRSDIRTDPVTGAVSSGVPLQLTFNVSRVQNSACTALTGAYMDVWHWDAGGVYSDVSGSGAGHRFLPGYQIT